MPRLSLPPEIPSDNDIPATLIGYVSVQGHKSVFEAGAGLEQTAKASHADKHVRDSVTAR